MLPWIARYLASCTPARAREASRVIRELSELSLGLHSELAAAGLAFGFERRGLLTVYRTEAGLEEGRKEASAQAALGPQVLDRAGVRELVPAVIGEPAGGIFYAGDAHCDPIRFVEAVGHAAVESGVRISPRTEVLSLLRTGSRIEGVRTTGGEVRAATTVLAAGAWSTSLARGVGLFLPVEGGKGYHVDFDLAPGDPGLPVAFAESRVIATPLPGRLRLAGTLELAGLDESVSPRRVEAIVRAGRAGIAGLEGRRAVGVWRGLRPCAPDGLPIVGPAPGLSGLVLATGHAMMGLTLAPITGRLVAELVSGRPASYELGPLRPDRFQPLIGREGSRGRRQPEPAGAGRVDG